MQPNFPQNRSSQGGFGHEAPSPYGGAAYDPPHDLELGGSGGFHVKYVTFASLVAIIASAIASGASPQGSDPPTVFLAVFVGGLVGWFFSAMTWIYKSWEFLPYHSRRTASGRAISPGDAVFFQFIPLYNLYWLFVQNLGYCEALDGVLAQGGHRVRAPRSLAIVCCVVWMIPYLNWVLGPFLWMAYMIVTDNAKAQLLTTRAP